MSNNNDIYIDSDNDDNFNNKEKFINSKNILEKEEITNNKSDSKNSKKTYKKMTDIEIKEYLKDSILIPKNEWSKLSVGSNISYFKNDGNFVKSGFIKTIYTNENTEYIKYGTKLNTYHNDKYYKEFTVNTTNIKELYKKIDKSAIIEYKIINQNILNTVNNIMDKISKIENELNNFNDRIIKLEENHIKTIKFIKKLHNIKSIDDVKNI
jgi:hypothetical protein